ncbi:MAG: alpha/beta fold hydrolase [Candidatus Hydrogenedentes bacterium]|nr:alpha/beta fold hydrolase [Candidatus Hydrogenedentota bacterium]
MLSFALQTTKWLLDIATKLVKADVRVHNVEAIQPDMAIIFVVNHFTRLETMLLPYEIHKHTGLEVWSLAAAELFVGRIGSYLRSTNNVSIKDPDRDKNVVRSLLAGDHPWLIFPEGAMVKDKKVVDERGMFRIFNKGIRRPPHKGAAVLALRAEFYRHKLECLKDSPHLPEVWRVLGRFGLESAEEVIHKRTVIIPVNVTYYPIRARDNIILRAARALAKNLSPRTVEELSVEGTLLSEDTDIDITLGEPIDVRDYLNAPEYAPLMGCGDRDLEALEADTKSLFNEAARRLMIRYMADIYRHTTVNYDHIFATIIRHQRAKMFTERAYRNRVFLCVRQIQELGYHRVHTLLTNTYRDILYEEPSPKFQDFLELCVKEGVVRKDGDKYYKDFTLRQGNADFHSVRQRELAYVLANEIEPLSVLTNMIKRIANTRRPELSKTIREIYLAEDQQVYAEDYARALGKDQTPPETGKPSLLLPKRLRAGIVLAHGYLAVPEEVRAMAEFFQSKGFAVYVVRLRGHGTSPEDLAQTRWEDWYESFNRGYAIIKSLTDHIILGGFSTGGGLALLAAGRKLAKIQAVFSINTPLHLRYYATQLASTVVTMNSLLKKVRKNSAGWVFVQHEPETPGLNYTRNPLSGIRELGRAMDAMEAALPHICVPTLIVQSAQDPIVSAASGESIFKRVGTKQKELMILHRERHGIINGPDAIDVFDRVYRFLRWAKGPSAKSPLAPDTKTDPPRAADSMASS